MMRPRFACLLALAAVALGIVGPIRGVALVAAAAADPASVAVECSPGDVRNGRHRPPKHVAASVCPALKVQAAPQLATVEPAPDLPVPRNAAAPVTAPRARHRSRAPPAFHAQARAPPPLG